MSLTMTIEVPVSFPHQGRGGPKERRSGADSASLRRRQKQQRFLDVRREMDQVHNLADPRPCDMAQRCQRAVAGDRNRSRLGEE